MRKENSDFKTSFVTEAGSFLHNKDYFAYVELDDMACWVIADGLDSDMEVDSAEMVVKSILGRFTEKPTMSSLRLKHYMQEAHEWLRTESKRVRLKASLILVVTDYAKIRWVAAGNARLYHFRGGRLFGRSRDQSLAQSMKDAGEISEEAMEIHEERHNLLQYMGQPERLEPYVSKKVPLSEGDVLLLCTHGLWEDVNATEMVDALADAKEPEDFTDTLEDVLLSKQRQTVSNYTAVAVYANKVFKEDPKRKWRLLKKWLLALIVLLLVGGGAAFYFIKQAAIQAENLENMFEYQKSADMYMKDGDYPKAIKDYSEARNMAIRLKDKFHRDFFAKKQRVMQLMVDGDEAFKGQDFAKALDKYGKAQEEAKPYKEFNHKQLEEKIDRSRTYMQVMNWVQEGDKKFEAQDYVGARSSYQKARKSALEEGYTDGEKDIRAKLESAEEKLTGLRKEKRLLEGEKYEKKGDQQFAGQDYLGAIDAYSAAQQIYQEIDMLERVLGMERKIDKALGKLNPAPPAAQPPAVANGSGNAGGNAGGAVGSSGGDGGTAGNAGGGGTTGNAAGESAPSNVGSGGTAGNAAGGSAPSNAGSGGTVGNAAGGSAPSNAGGGSAAGNAAGGAVPSNAESGAAASSG